MLIDDYIMSYNLLLCLICEGIGGASILCHAEYQTIPALLPDAGHPRLYLSLRNDEKLGVAWYTPSWVTLSIDK